MENCWSFVANILQWICGRHCSIESHGHTSLSLNVIACDVQPNLQVKDSLQDLSIENNFQNYSLVEDTLQSLSSAGPALHHNHDGDTNMEHQRDFEICPSTSMLDNQRRPLLDEDSFQNFRYFKKYDVFLNHRGPDVKSSFVSHLNEALISVGLNPFLDAKSLVKGHHAFHSINEALTGVGVHVAIFSKRYAESKYCLNELCDMLKSGKPILPVYFDIDPVHLRWPHDGPFANAFIKHKTRGREKEIMRWKVALLEVANITGFLLSEVNGDEAKLKKRIVNAVLDVLSPSQYVQIPRHRVALEDSMKDVVERMDMIQDDVVKVVGIVGMGGIGKTTLAAQVYNHFVKQRERFQGQSFLKDVKENSIFEMQRQLVHDLFQKDLQNNKEYISYWFDRLSNRKALIIIDDVNHRSQFDSLVPQIKTLGSGSRVLVTSRDRNLLNNITQGQTANALYEVKELNFIDSSRLFNWHTFCSEEPSDGFHDLAKEVVQACGGLPLALEVIGAFLYDKKTPNDVICWRQASHGLGMNVDISKKLKISYDSLNCQEQGMFLDISCFLIGKEENFALKIWESRDSYMSPQLSLRVLRDKSLIKIDGLEHKISMHDVLRDMGREVVMRQSHVDGERSHLWNAETSWSVVEGNQGSNRVKGLYLSGGHPGKIMAANKFATMCGLQFLILQACEVEGDFSTWPKCLKWLRWSENSKLLELPSTLDLFNLAVLDLSLNQHLSQLWVTKRGKQVHCPRLRILLLNDCMRLKELPQDLGSLSRLQTLEMDFCFIIKILPDSIGNLKELQHLSLRHCECLEGLPESIVQLSNLKVINLSGCRMLRELPELFGNLQRLVTFDVSYSRLSKLPRTFSQLINLEEIHLQHCIELHELPTSMKHFTKLKVFNALDTISQNLPKDFEQLHNLNVLKLHTTQVDSISMSQNSVLNLRDTLEVLELTNCIGHPFNIHGFTGLKALTLDNSSLGDFLGVDQHQVQLIHTNPNYDEDIAPLFKITNGITKLSKLETLKLKNCKYVIELPSSLLNLRPLTLYNCPLQALPNDFGILHNLDALHIDLSPDLRKLTISKLLDSFSKLSNLKYLTLKNFKDLQELPSSMMGLQRLRQLTLHGCPLQALPHDFGLLHNLESLDIDLSTDLHKPTISKLPDSILELSNLQYLALKNFKDLQELPSSISGLVMLHHFEISSSMVKSLPSYIKYCTKLKTLTLQFAYLLQKLPESFSSLKQLETLHLIFNRDLIELPNGFGELEALIQLDLEGCSLKDIARRDLKFGLLTSLTKLNLKYNPIMIAPKILENLGSLKYLNMSHCKKLTTIEGLPNTLEILDFGGCRKLAFIPSIATLKKLTFFSLCNCEALKHLCGLEALEALKELNLSGCSTLQCSSVLSSNVILERCYLSGSSVFISYDNDWTKMEPSQQIITYYDKSFPISNMSLTQTPMHVECGTQCCIDVIITNKEECLAIIFFIIAHDQGWSKDIYNHGCYDSRCFIEARLIRNNVQIKNYALFKLRHADSKDQVYICTLRRDNSLVRNSKYGDKICLFLTSKYLGWTATVNEAIVCVMHTSKGEVGEVQGTVKGGGHVGSTSNTMSQEMMKMFSKLLLGDNLEKQNNVIIQSIEDSNKSSCIMVEEDSINKSNSIWEQGSHLCDGCFMDIENQRWHCQECADFDLCEPCHNGANSNRLPKSHKVDHPMQLYIGHDAE